MDVDVIVIPWFVRMYMEICNPKALASGLSPLSADNCGIIRPPNKSA